MNLVFDPRSFVMIAGAPCSSCRRPVNAEGWVDDRSEFPPSVTCFDCLRVRYFTRPS